MRGTYLVLATGAAVALCGGPAFAATLPIVDATITIIPDSGDSAFLYTSVLVALLAAVPGIILYSAGATGRSHLSHMVTLSVAAIAMATLIFFAIGYSLAFDTAGSAWIGAGNQAMLNAMGTVRDGTTVAETGFVLLHWAYVAIAIAALVALLAARAHTGWLMGFAAAWLLLVLVPVMRWIWGGGWLAQWGSYDAAGGVTIFFTVACSAMAALVLIGRDADSEPAAGDDNLKLGGALLLFIGTAALTAGATLGAGDDAAVAILATCTAAMTGALMAAALNRSISAGALADGLIAGTVAIAVAGDGVAIGAAWLIGALAALAAHFGPRLTPKIIRWPDHGGVATRIAAAAKAGGVLTAIFLSFDWFTGAGYAAAMTMTSQLVAQLVALLAIGLWSVLISAVVALSVAMVLPMRRSAA